MTGSQQGGLVIGFLALICWFLAAICAILGIGALFFGANMMAGACLAVAAILALLGTFQWRALRRKENAESRARQEDERERRRTNPFYNALCVLGEHLRARVPGGSFTVGQRSNDGEDYLAVGPSSVTGWNGDEPESVAGIPYATWKAAIPETVNGYRVELQIHAPRATN